MRLTAVKRPTAMTTGSPLRERRDLGLGVADRALVLPRPPAVRVGDEVLVPVGRAVDRPRREALGVEAVRGHDAAVGAEAEERLDARDLARREDEQARRRVRPAPHPPRPRLGVRPRRRRAVGDPLEHEQLGAVEVHDDRHVGRDARRGLVHRREVVEVEHVVLAAPAASSARRPGGDVPLVLVVVHGGEHAVGGVGPVLVGRVHRRVAGGEVDGVDVEARVEALGVAHAAAAERPGDDRDVPAVGGQLLAPARGPRGRSRRGGRT